MRYLKELYEGEMVSEVYLCKQVQNLKTKANKSYMSLTLQDKTGTFDGKIWELNNGIEHFEAMDYIKVDGQVTAFQGALQLNIRRVRRASEGEYDTADYMPCTDKDVEAMLTEIRGIAKSVKEPHLAQLLAEFFENKPFLHGDPRDCEVGEGAASRAAPCGIFREQALPSRRSAGLRSR